MSDSESRGGLVGERHRLLSRKLRRTRDSNPQGPRGPVDFKFSKRRGLSSTIGRQRKGALTINGKQVGEGRIEKPMGAVYSLAGDTADVGMDAQTPVTDDYDPWNNAFTGTINTVKVRHKN